MYEAKHICEGTPIRFLTSRNIWETAYKGIDHLILTFVVKIGSIFLF